MVNYKKLIIIFIITTFLFIIYQPILKPSYVSVMISCFPDGLQKAKVMGYSVAGEIRYNLTTNNSTIKIFYNKDNITLKHEHIHLIQIQQHRFFSCRLLPLKYLNEVEAYTFQNLPDKYYVKLYGRY